MHGCDVIRVFVRPNPTTRTVLRSRSSIPPYHQHPSNHITCRHLINPSFLIASPPPWPIIAAAKCVERLLTTKIRHLESELTRMKLELSRRGTELSDMGGKYEQSEERRRDLASVVTRLEEDLAVAQGSDASQGGHQGHDQSSLAQVMHVSICFIWDWFRERCM